MNADRYAYDTIANKITSAIDSLLSGKLTVDLGQFKR